MYALNLPCAPTMMSPTKLNQQNEALRDQVSTRQDQEQSPGREDGQGGNTIAMGTVPSVLWEGALLSCRALGGVLPCCRAASATHTPLVDPGSWTP